LSIFLTLGIGTIEGVDLFGLIQTVLAFLAPPLAVVFLLGVIWPGANSTGALSTLIIGTIVSIPMGLCNMFKVPNENFWPHFMVLAFYIFAGLMIFMILVSLVTGNKTPRPAMESLRLIYKKEKYSIKMVCICWGILAVIMGAIYIIFNTV